MHSRKRVHARVETENKSVAESVSSKTIGYDGQPIDRFNTAPEDPFWDIDESCAVHFK